MFMRSLYIVISRPCGPKSFMGISRPWSRNCYSMFVERGGNFRGDAAEFFWIKNMEIWDNYVLQD